MGLPNRFQDRPTADLIVFFLAAVVGVILIAMTFIVVISAIWFPDHNITLLTQRVGTLVSSLIGAIVGYLAGRGVNGK